MKSINLFNTKSFLSALLFISILTGCNNGTTKSESGSNTKQEAGTAQITPATFSDVFLEGDYERIYKQMSETFQKKVSLKQFKKIGENFNKKVQSYELLSEIPAVSGTRYVWRDGGQSKGMVAVFDNNHTITGLQVMPLEAHPKADQTFTKTTFNLPFDGEWFVFWGGTNQLVNYHYKYPNQRYAFDYVIMKGNRSYAGDPAKNESYYAFGEEVLAPADGKVIKVENGIHDNEPVGQMNEKNPAGNYVVIQHGNGEYSLLAHFKYQSIKVKAGDQIKQGDVIGLCGNSGNSSEPHIHFHVADSPDLAKSKAIRIQFEEDRKLIQGDTVKFN